MRILHQLRFGKSRLPRGNGDSLEAEAVGKHFGSDPEAMQDRGEQQRSGWAVGLGGRRLPFGNIKPGCNRHPCSPRGQFTGSACEMPGAEWPEQRFRPDQPALSWIAANEPVNLRNKKMRHEPDNFGQNEVGEQRTKTRQPRKTRMTRKSIRFVSFVVFVVPLSL